MNRDQLNHAIRTASELTGKEAIIIIGSQAILGSYDDSELPEPTTRSMEVDALPIADSHDEIVMLADILEGVAGELSPYDDNHGFHIDGVDDTTAILPDRWRERLVPVCGPGTTNVVTGQVCTGWCLEPHDLCVAKLCAHREKDLNFVRALIEARLVDPGTIASRLSTVPEAHRQASLAGLVWLALWLNTDS